VECRSRANLSVLQTMFFIDLTDITWRARRMRLCRSRSPHHPSHTHRASLRGQSGLGASDRTTCISVASDDNYPDFYRSGNGSASSTGMSPPQSAQPQPGPTYDDHTGNYGSAIDGVNTPEVQVAGQRLCRRTPVRSGRQESLMRATR